ncbi:MAG: TIGR02186 family protein, partial [Bdellovibrionales bacterium]
RILNAIFLGVFCLAVSAQPAWAKRTKVVAANLTDNFVGVSEGFDGAKLTVFGVLKNRADAVIVIEGPPVEAKVRAKVKQAGIWINGQPQIIGPVPSYYAVVSSKPIKEIVGEKTALEYGLDIDHLPLAQTPAGAGYVSTKKGQGLFRYRERGVNILESNLFRADLFLPASVPIGAYQAHIYEFSKGNLTAKREETLNVAQVGLNADISRMARTQPAGYALLALMLSLGIGGGSAYVFRKMS